MKHEKHEVVIGTNIIISAAISEDGSPAKIFELILENRIINYTTNEIIAEVKKVFERPKISRYMTHEYKKFVLDNYLKKIRENTTNAL